MAIAPKILVAIYHMFSEDVHYNDLSDLYLDKLNNQQGHAHSCSPSRTPRLHGYANAPTTRGGIGEHFHGSECTGDYLLTIGVGARSRRGRFDVALYDRQQPFWCLAVRGATLDW